MKRFLHPAIFVIAVVIVLEECLWDGLKRGMRKLSALPIVAAAEQRLRKLGPWASLAVLMLPATILLPCKLAAVWALSHHHPMLGLTVLLAAKLAGTSMAAYLFDIVRDSARQLVWFDRCCSAVIHALDRTKTWLARQPTYRAAVTAVATARARTARLVRRLATRSRLRRKLHAAKVLAYAIPVAALRATQEPSFTVSEQLLGVPSANDEDEPDVWARWPDGSMCAVGIDLCRALRRPGRSSDYQLVHVIEYAADGIPSEWVIRTPPESPPVSFSRAARRGSRYG
ncbi:MAG TPA: hypothetical protein VNU48_03695 [Burkholderiaceae bacterium]|nr:hypothetical protein [Burkholderiaceae bacterium]